MTHFSVAALLEKIGYCFLEFNFVVSFRGNLFLCYNIVNEVSELFLTARPTCINISGGGDSL